MMVRFATASDAARWVMSERFPRCRVFAYGVEFDGTLEPTCFQGIVKAWTERMEDKGRRLIPTETWVEVE